VYHPILTMMKMTIGVLTMGLLLAGCGNPPGSEEPTAGVEMPHKKVETVSHSQGPGGGEWMDRTSPVGLAAAVPAGGTESAFPDTAQPSKGG
jgi:hypothetical protein